MSSISGGVPPSAPATPKFGRANQSLTDPDAVDLNDVFDGFWNMQDVLAADPPLTGLGGPAPPTLASSNEKRVPPHNLPSSLGFTLNHDHQPASIPFHGHRPGTVSAMMPSDAGAGKPSDDDQGCRMLAKDELDGDGDGSATKRRRVPTPTAMTLSDSVGVTRSSLASLAGSSAVTEQQRLERRERNREHAKRSRIRKKFLLESLQDQVQSLRNENMSLRRVVNEQMPEKATEILQTCTTEYSCMLAPTSALDGGELNTRREIVEQDYNLIQALLSSQQCFAISDPSLPDNPIVYVSGGFLKLTGYSMDRVLGRNCRFLQGPGTDQRAVDVIRQGVSAGRDTSVCLLNYKADGTPFWNQFFVAPLRDADGTIVNFVGVQCEVSTATGEAHAQKYRAMAKLPTGIIDAASRGALIGA